MLTDYLFYPWDARYISLYGLFIICHAGAIFGWEMPKFIMIEKTVGKKWGSPSGILSMEQETCGFY